MKIQSVEISNILSIESASLTFGEAGLVLVEGFDYDTQRANGAGKSAIFNSISFALYDKIPRRITKSEILRNGTRSGYAHVKVSTGSGVYEVRRERPSKVTFYKDSSPIDITQEEFERNIGLNYEQFLITMYTAQDSADKFIELNDSQKKNFLLKIMNLSKFTKAKGEVADRQAKLSQALQLGKAKLDGLKSNIEIYKESLVDPVDIQARIDQNEKDITAYKKAIKELEDILPPDLSKYTELEDNLQKQMLQLNDTKNQLRQLNIEYRNLKNFKPDAQCPECSVDLVITGRSLHKCDSTGNEDTLKELTLNINKLEEELLKEQEYRDLANKIKLKKQEEYSDYNNAQSSISEYRNSINLKSAENTNLREQVSKNEDTKLKIGSITTDAEALSTKLDALDSEIFLLDAVASVFDNTGAPAYVMDSIVDGFNEAVSEYITEIWPNATYTLQTYKQNKDKSIRAKFSDVLTINGEERSIGSLSGGELRALSLALDFAIIDVLSTQYGLSLNPIILDEPFNGLDSTGREIVVDVLTKFSQLRQVWVVDHASEAKAMFNRVVRVEKRNGISKIV